MQEKKNDRWRNQVKATLPPRYRRLVASYAECNEISCSEAVRIMVRSFIDSMPKEQLQKLQSKNSY